MENEIKIRELIRNLIESELKQMDSTQLNEVDFVTEASDMIAKIIKNIESGIYTIERETKTLPNNYTSPQKMSLDKIKKELDNLRNIWQIREI